MKNKIGVCTIAFKRTDIFKAIRMVSDAGADGIEVWGQPPHVGCPTDERRAAEIRRAADQAGLEICAYGSYYKSGEPTEYCGVALDAANQVKIASLLGTRVIRIWAGTQNYDTYSPKRREAIYQDIRGFAQVAANAEIALVLERHNDSLTNSWASPKNVFAELANDSVRLNYQVVYPTSVDILQTHAVADYYYYLSVSAHAHLQNYVEGAEGRLARTFLAEGVVDYSRLGKAAALCGYSGYFAVEFLPDQYEGYSQVEALRRDIDFLRGLPDG